MISAAYAISVWSNGMKQVHIYFFLFFAKQFNTSSVKGQTFQFLKYLSFIFQKYAVEALVYSSSKKDRCSGVIKQATPILKELYQSKNEYIKVRALVVRCVEMFQNILELIFYFRNNLLTLMPGSVCHS